MTSDPKYLRGRQSHVNASLPQGPEDFVHKLMQKGAQNADTTPILDEQLMPCVLSMAKYHVEAINCMHQMATANAADKTQASTDIKSI